MSDRTDFNDMAAVCGFDAVRSNIESAMNTSQPSSASPSSNSYTDTAAWPALLPLPSGLPPVIPFDFDLLPEALRPWIADVANRVQCPPDFPAVGAVIALATVVGRKIGIRPKQQDDWLEVHNLWGAIVGRPGVMKSPALRAALNPLTRLEFAASLSYAEQHSDWGRGGELHKLQADSKKHTNKKKLDKGLMVGIDDMPNAYEEEEPKQRRYIVNDCSVEALGEILRGNPNGSLAYRDELIGLLKSLDKEGNEGARGFFLSAWSGTDSYTFDRIGRGLNIRIDACCLSLLGSIQPSVIGDYLRQTVATNGGDGLLSRFQLLVWPDIACDWVNVDQWPDTEAKTAAFATFTRLDELNPAAFGATPEGEGIPYLRFDNVAQQVFDTWRSDFEPRLRGDGDHDAIIAHLSKYRKLIPALALLFHLADNTSGAIGEAALLRALAWAEYLESHARRAYASVMQCEIAGARALLKRIKSNDVPNPFTYRDVYLKGWAGLTTPEATREAVRYLADLDCLRKETQPTDGRTKTVIWINPKVMG